MRQIRTYFYSTLTLLFLFTYRSQPYAHPTARATDTVGLPAPWKQKDIGTVKVPGHTDYDGRQFMMEAAGNARDGAADEVHFVYFPIENEVEITARVIPQPISKSSKFGLMMRETLAANSAQASLLFQSGPLKTPVWQTLLVSRSASGKPVQTKIPGPALTEAVITEGRLAGEYWLRLQRRFNSFTAFSSTDGKTWTSLGSTFVEMNKKFFAGFTVSSGEARVKTRVIFDNVSIPGWKSGE